jgi:hypothetical protein
MAGTPATAGASGGAAGAAPAGPEPCPSGWMCTDIGAAGFEATDKDGNSIAASCSNGGLVECDDANPTASCPALKNPFCAHLDVAGTKIVSCAQLCTL